MRAADASHATPYACAGSQQLTRQSLRLCRLLTIHTPILTLVKVANNADKFLRLCRLPTIHTPILMPVQAPNNSHVNPYACARSRQLTRQSLRL
ncbi:hypothetical protein O181_132077 [Austropuccinia psidii MF-1]|uniref:Uncharacterized protein n=1 Tax=Austropuccinia psidii MF-1 TaxID=1389203 RepID=A0A9Q3L4B2_9BASI|nr:hypothetical protein [Austropuccinia psidii MF-1]